MARQVKSALLTIGLSNDGEPFEAEPLANPQVDKWLLPFAERCRPVIPSHLSGAAMFSKIGAGHMVWASPVSRHAPLSI